MRAVFVEFSAFARHRDRYLDDNAFRLLQEWLMRVPELGSLIQGSGGLRVIYFHWPTGPQFWLFTVYEKGEVDDLTPEQKAVFRSALKAELLARQYS